MTSEGFSWPQYLEVVEKTDVGLRRSNNQDSHGVSLAQDLEDWRERGHLFVVADGMGAHAAGELASKLAVDHVAHLYRKHREAAPPEAIRAAIEEANEEIHRRGQANLSYHNMGTTCSSLLLVPQGAVIAHVGDSRVYVAREGWVRQLTFDHSLVWEVRQATKSGDAEDIPGIPKNVITRSLGPQPHVAPDLEGPFATEVNDTFLLCSDGLTGRVGDEELAAFLTYCEPEAAATGLVSLAVLRGGHDNITLIVVKILSERLTTRGSRAGPLVVSETPHDRPPLATGWWIGLGVCVLLSGMLGIMGNVTASLLTAAAAVTLGIAIWALQADLFGVGRTRLDAQDRLGKGPYTKSKAHSVEDFVRLLRETVREAVRQAVAAGWKIDAAVTHSGLEQVEHDLAGRQPRAALARMLVLIEQLALAFHEQARGKGDSD